MNKINEKISEILNLERTAAERKEKEKRLATKKIKEVHREKQRILEDAIEAAQKERDRIIMEKRKQAEEEAKKIILNADLNSKKISQRILKRKGEIFDFLSGELDAFLVEKSDSAGK